jgi:hypothetical protein
MPKFDFRYNNREAIDAERAKTLPSERLTWAANTSAEGKSGLMVQSRQRIRHGSLVVFTDISNLARRAQSRNRLRCKCAEAQSGRRSR